MRERLNLPQIDRQKMEVVKNLIDCIAENPNNNCSSELDELMCITGKHHTAMEFAEYWGWTDLDTLAEIALTSEPPCVYDLSQKEIEEIVLIIKNGLISGDDRKANYYIELLRKSLPLTNVSDYINSEDSTEKIAKNMITAASNSVIFL